MQAGALWRTSDIWWLAGTEWELPESHNTPAFNTGSLNTTSQISCSETFELFIFF